MKLINNTYKHAKAGFQIKVTTCNAKIVTCYNTTDSKEQKFNRSKFEWMISKGIFVEVKENETPKPVSDFVKESCKLTPEQAQKVDSLPAHERKAFLAKAAKENGAVVDVAARKQRLISSLTSVCSIPSLHDVKQFNHDNCTYQIEEILNSERIRVRKIYNGKLYPFSEVVPAEWAKQKTVKKSILNVPVSEKAEMVIEVEASGASDITDAEKKAIDIVDLFRTGRVNKFKNDPGVIANRAVLNDILFKDGGNFGWTGKYFVANKNIIEVLDSDCSDADKIKQISWIVETTSKRMSYLQLFRARVKKSFEELHGKAEQYVDSTVVAMSLLRLSRTGLCC
ncbi:TPA: hypothetical protein NJ322_005037 [Vibrio parahaemolyticus]|nr:hypothetical protein [Vibrio parahaemolyticus]HCG7105681.1 hypothetical protein [Vibrio parahaemolyticus]